MHFFNRLTAVFLAAAMAAPLAPLEARTKKGDKFLAEGRIHEQKKEWDAALADYRKALAEDPAEMVYQIATDKARFQDGQYHVDQGLKIRASGQLGEALLEFQKAYTINPASSVAAQELMLTQQMIERERKRVEETGKPAPPAERGLTPAEEIKKETQDKIDRMLPVPELKPLNPTPIHDLKINGQPVRVLYETIGKVAGINVLWDPEFQAPPRNTFNIDFQNSTLEQALEDIAVITKTYWKPLSANTIFVTNDNPNKRRDYAEMVAQTFYLNNVSSAQEIQEIVNAVRSIAELQRVVAFTSQNAIIVRGEADQVALAAKMIHDLDKPRAEVVVDIMVMEASSVFSRQLTTALASTGLNVPLNFTPRSGLQVQSTTTNTNNTNNNNLNNGLSSVGTTGTSTTTGTAIPLNNLGHLSTADFSMTLPSALLQAALSDTKTRVLQAPQLRTVDNVKATLKIGEREPTATGSFQPGIGGVGINPLVNTQFNYIDVGVNVELQAHVHDNGDVSIHIDLDISTVSGYANIGGIQQPIIGQRKVTHDIRMHEGDVNLLGGLINSSDTKQVTGIPGLSSIPLLRRLFSGDSVDHERDELMIVLIPHIIRQPDIGPGNLRGIAVGNQTAIKLNYAPKESDVVSGPQAAAALQGGAPPPAAAMPAPVPVAPPAATAPQTAPPATVQPSTTPPAAGPPATAPPMTVPGLPPGAPSAATLPATTAPATTAPAAGVAQIQFSPPTVQTGVGSPVSLSLAIEGGTDVSSAPMQISWDPKILKLNDVTRGDFLSNDGQQPIFTKNIMNDSGTATIQLGRQPGTPGVNGSGVLVNLNFQAVGKGTGLVFIPNLMVRNSQGQPVVSGSPRATVSVQ
jgi:general secretion pathway protein D